MAVAGWNPAEYSMHQQSRRDDMMRNLLNMFMQKKQFEMQDRRYQDQTEQQKFQNEMAQKDYALNERNIASQEQYRNRPQTGELSSDAKTMQYFIQTGQASNPQEAYKLLTELKQSGRSGDGLTPSLAYRMGRDDKGDAEKEGEKEVAEVKGRREARMKEADRMVKSTELRLKSEAEKLDRLIRADQYGTNSNTAKYKQELANINEAMDYVTKANMSALELGALPPRQKRILGLIGGNISGVKSGITMENVRSLIEKEGARRGLTGGEQAPATQIPPEVSEYMKKHPEVPTEEVMAMYAEYMKIKK